MLVNEVVETKAIALAATENASNQIPYLGLQFFPAKKKAGLDYFVGGSLPDQLIISDKSAQEIMDHMFQR